MNLAHPPLKVFKLVSASGTNATVVKASPGAVYGWFMFNADALKDGIAHSAKLYDKASAPTVGTDTPLLTIALPAGGGANVSIPQGVSFTKGIALAITDGPTDAETGGVQANEVVVNLFYT